MSKTKEEILSKGTKSYCGALYSVEMYKQGNCPLNDVEASIYAAMDEYAKQILESFEDWRLSNDIKHENGDNLGWGNLSCSEKINNFFNEI